MLHYSLAIVFFLQLYHYILYNASPLHDGIEEKKSLNENSLQWKSYFFSQLWME